MKPTNICVYCASSQQVDPAYFAAAAELGTLLGTEGIRLTYGGGAVGLMGQVADAALAAGGAVTGVLPRFMDELEWGHGGITELCLVDDMHARKQRMMQGADALIALPGGCGTLEELLEAITWKRLGLCGMPILLLNTLGFYDPLLEMLERCVGERFMRPEHRDMWQAVDTVAAVLPAIDAAPPWDEGQRRLATW